MHIQHIYICAPGIQSESIIAHQCVATRVAATAVAHASSSHHARAENGSVSCAQFPCDFIFIGTCVSIGRASDEKPSWEIEIPIRRSAPAETNANWICFLVIRWSTGEHFSVRTDGGGDCSCCCCVRCEQCTRAPAIVSRTLAYICSTYTSSHSPESQGLIVRIGIDACPDADERSI